MPPCVQLAKRHKVNTEKAVFLGDWHIPYHDPVATGLAIDFTVSFRPDTLFILGDFLDFYQVSRYDKDPGCLLDLQKDINTAKSVLRSLRKRLPKTRIIFMAGNHEHRLVCYLNNHPEISTLDTLQLSQLLGLYDLGIDYFGYHEQFRWHGLLVEHGNLSRKKAGQTAAAMLEARGVSGVSGHCHRLATHYHHDESGVKVWCENGCLCAMNCSYIIGKPNWMHGFTVAFGLEGDQRFSVEQATIIKNKLYYHGELWM